MIVSNLITSRYVDVIYRAAPQRRKAGYPALHCKHGQRLAAQVKLLQNFLVARRVALVQVVKQGTALTNHLQETTARMLVFLVSLEMFSELLDLLGEDADLHLRRTSVTLVGGQAGNNLGFSLRL